MNEPVAIDHLCVWGLIFVVSVAALFKYVHFLATGGIEDFVERMKPERPRPVVGMPRREDFEDYEAYEKARHEWEYQQSK